MDRIEKNRVILGAGLGSFIPCRVAKNQPPLVAASDGFDNISFPELKDLTQTAVHSCQAEATLRPPKEVRIVTSLLKSGTKFVGRPLYETPVENESSTLSRLHVNVGKAVCLALPHPLLTSNIQKVYMKLNCTPGFAPTNPQNILP